MATNEGGIQSMIDSRLRPTSFEEYIGQKRTIESLKLFVRGVQKRETVAEHILLYGPPGIGKTTLSHIIAHELKGALRITSGPAIEKKGDLAAILTSLKDNDVLFIDEIHRLPKSVEEAFYPVMEEFFLDIILGKGPAARTVRLPVPKITIIGATTRMSLLSAPFRDRFGLILRLNYYSTEDMTQIIMRSAKILEIPIDESVALSIANRARRTPRIANRILKRVRDLYQVEGHKVIDNKVIDRLFSILQIDAIGLNDIDIVYLNTLLTKFSGGPVGVTTIATAISEDPQTIEEYIEPYLIQGGLIKKTPKGRVLTERAFTHLKLFPLPQGESE